MAEGSTGGASRLCVEQVGENLLDIVEVGGCVQVVRQRGCRPIDGLKVS